MYRYIEASTHMVGKAGKYTHNQLLFSLMESDNALAAASPNASFIVSVSSHYSQAYLYMARSSSLRACYEIFSSFSCIKSILYLYSID